MFGLTALVTTLILTTVAGCGTGFAIVCITESGVRKTIISEIRKKGEMEMFDSIFNAIVDWVKKEFG